MILTRRNEDHVDGYLWQVYLKECNPRTQSNILKSNKIYLYMCKCQYLGLSKNTVGNMYAVLRCYCGRDLQDGPVTPFGGPLYAVKRDESQFEGIIIINLRRLHALIN